MNTNAIKKKIKSNRGASLSIALLLVLFCGVVGSIILTSGTAAAGRLSQLAKSDQRYYSVTSAADLLGSMFDGKTVSIIRTKSVTTTNTSTYQYVEDDNGRMKKEYTGSYSDSGTPDYTVKTFEGTLEPVEGMADVTFLTRAVNTMMFDTITPGLNEDVWSPNRTTHGTEVPLEFTLEHSDNYDFLDASVKATLKPNGDIVLVVSNTDDAENTYRIRLTFTADLTQTSTSNTVHGTPSIDDDPDVGGTETTTSIKTETKRTSITWTLAETKKIE